MASCSWKILLLQCLASDFLCGLAISYQSNIYVYTKKSKLCIRSSHGWFRVGFRILCVLLICLPQGLMDSFWCQLTPTLLKALTVHQVWTEYRVCTFQTQYQQNDPPSLLSFHPNARKIELISKAMFVDSQLLFWWYFLSHLS